MEDMELTKSQAQQVRDSIAANGHKPVTMYGIELKPTTRGSFPYDCISRDKNPNAMIYRAESGSWTHDTCPDFMSHYFRQHCS